MFKHKVIIIGGGIAGLAAANELIENGINNILILEPQKRMGGRVLSIPFDGSKTVELGAQWLYGTDSELYGLCKRLNLIEKNKNNFEKKICYSTPHGNIVDENYVNKIVDKMETLLNDVEKNAKSVDEDVTLGSAINERYMQYFDKKISRKHFDHSQIPLINAIYGAVLKEEKNDIGCDSLDDLSLQGWVLTNDYENPDIVDFKSGFWPLLKYFQRQIPYEKIAYEQEVIKIYWPPETPSDEDGKHLSDQVISILTVNPETGQELLYLTDYCICTIPLGCLKNKHKDLFVPKLPESKISAIESLGFGTVNKIFIVFDDQVFYDGTEGVQILWRTDMNIELQTLKKWKIEKPTFYESFECFESLPKSKHILFTSISGPDAVYIEQLTDECLMDILDELFFKCFPNIRFPRIKGLVRSNWYSDKYFKGSHTYIKYGSSLKDVLELSKSLNNKVFFAGEATSTRFNSVDGAYESGLRNAERIVKLIDERR